MHLFGFTIAGITGAVVSLIGFVIGMRVAKERADRAVLRALYQELYAHFRSIRDLAEQGRPKDWMDFKFSGDRYIPLVKSLENDGRINVLPKRLAAQMSFVEMNSLNTGYKFKETMRDKLAPIVSEAFEADVTKPTQSINGSPYSVYGLGELALGREFSRDNLIDAEGNKVGVSIELSMKAGRTSGLFAFEQTLKNKFMPEFLSKIEHLISSHEASKQQANNLRAAMTEVETLLKEISRRIKDPNPFFETLITAIPDVFRR
jgi:hypothetical protein